MKTMKSKRTMGFFALYSVVMLGILIGTVGYLLGLLYRSVSAPRETEIEVVYVPVEQKQTEAPVQDSETEVGWTVREYHGRIGIFRRDGTLIQVLDTDVKTLPKADQALLGEGIMIDSRSALNAVVEDYSD